MREAIRRALVERGRYALAGASRSALLHALGGRVYAALERPIGALFGTVAGVRAVYLTHGLAHGVCHPGLSDYDLVVVFEAGDMLAFYEAFRRRWNRLRGVLPVADVVLCTRADLDAWQRGGGGLDPVDEIPGWRLLWGDELRHAVPPALGGAQAERDRISAALGHFQGLMGLAIKQERVSPQFAVVARRQIAKTFWRSVFSVDPEILALPTERARVAAWIALHGRPEPTGELLAQAAARFQRGPISTLRFEAAALAFQELTRALAGRPLLAAPLPAPRLLPHSSPPGNHAAVEARARVLAASIVEMLGDGLDSLLLTGTGCARGWSFNVVLIDELPAPALVSALAHLRAIFRAFDDPWWNEQFPAGAPVVSSRTIFLARLHAAPAGLHFTHAHRRVLWGRDPYAAAVGDAPAPSVFEQERLLYSLFQHRLYLGRLKPALHDFITFHAPRLALERRLGQAPATAEDAVAAYERESGDPFPRRVLAAHAGKDLDQLLRAMAPGDFAQAWPFLEKIRTAA